MQLADAIVIAAAGLAAGTINTVIGAGSLLTFPVLIGVGYSPYVANVSNTVGLIFGSASGTIGYRQELAGQRERVVRLMPASLLGGLAGAVLLLAVPGTFESIVPFLILLAVVLVAAQPWISGALERMQRARGKTSTELIGPALFFTFLTGVYGGYFGAAQGVLLMAVLGLFVPDGLQRLNGLKNLLATGVNAVAAVIFIVLAPVAWDAALVLGAGAVVGGLVGARLGRRLPPGVLRVGIVVVGTLVAVRMFIG